jgi:hypothetical protein
MNFLENMNMKNDDNIPHSFGPGWSHGPFWPPDPFDPFGPFHPGPWGPSPWGPWREPSSTSSTSPKKLVYIWVNGILTFPGDSNNWNGKAATWINIHTPHKSEKIEYFVGPISRAFGQKKRSEKLARTMEFYKDWDIILGGHSNGCDVILDALNVMKPTNVKALHLISAACEADFERNGLNNLNINDVHVYIAGKDRALQLAASWVGHILGYGILGKIGPQNAKMKVETFLKSEFDHTDWFSKENFEYTMERITGYKGRTP